VENQWRAAIKRRNRIRRNICSSIDGDAPPAARCILRSANSAAGSAYRSRANAAEERRREEEAAPMEEECISSMKNGKNMKAGETKDNMVTIMARQNIDRRLYHALPTPWAAARAWQQQNLSAQLPYHTRTTLRLRTRSSLPERYTRYCAHAPY